MSPKLITVTKINNNFVFVNRRLFKSYTGNGEAVDFNDTTQLATFTPNGPSELLVEIPVFDDEVDEADEGFVMMLELEESLLSGSVDLSLRNLTFVKIVDNDRKF